jgi:hypothetical protein
MVLREDDSMDAQRHWNHASIYAPDPELRPTQHHTSTLLYGRATPLEPRQHSVYAPDLDLNCARPQHYGRAHWNYAPDLELRPHYGRAHCQHSVIAHTRRVETIVRQYQA